MFAVFAALFPNIETTRTIAVILYSRKRDIKELDIKEPNVKEPNNKEDSMTKRIGQAYRLATCIALGASLVVGTAAPTLAQKKKPAAKPAPQTNWVKLCETATIKRMDKKGKTNQVKRNICLTQHERLNGTNGTVLISVALRDVEGQKHKRLMIMVPLGMLIQPGLKAAIYSPQQWNQVLAKKRVADKNLKPIALKFSLCYVAGCTAEVDAPPDLVDSMTKGGGLMVIALEPSGRPAAFPVPLQGFTQAMKGKPIDIKKYGEARARLMRTIQEKMRRRIVDQRTGGKVPEPKKN